MTTLEDAIILDLSGLEPTPERLLEVVRGTVSLRPSALVVHWAERFPWSIDDAPHRGDRYADALPLEVARCASQAGVRFGVVLSAAFPSEYSARRSYRHLERSRTGASSEWLSAARKLSSDALDDLAGLMPDLGFVAVPYGARDADLIAEAAAEVNINVARIDRTLCDRSSCGVGSAAADFLMPYAALSGIEERLAVQGHPCADRGEIPAVHERFRAWRSRCWVLVGALHEALSAASAGYGSAGRALVARRAELGRALSELREIRRAIRALYERRSSAEAVERFIGLIASPLHEQYTALSARVAALRRVR